MSLFGRKTGGSARKKSLYFEFFLVFGGFLLCKALMDSHFHPFHPSKKNRA